jgi:hypothetical protein
MSGKQADDDGMAMPGWLDKLGGFVERTQGFWRKLGAIENPAYYDPGFTAAEEATIRELAGATARRLGYGI